METCLWCTASAESDAAVTRVLNRYCTDAMTPKEMQDANSDFIYCLECVVEYHRARERVPALHKHLWKLETARLLKVFRDMLEADLEDSDLFFVDDEQEQPVSKFTPEEFLNGLRFPLMEVLKYPYLLCDRDLCEMVVNVLCKMEDMQNPLPVHDQYQGIYLLMVHPNEKVRHWAIATARSLGRVDRDNYYDLQEVFLCMFYIIDLGITVDFPNVDDSYCSGKLQMLPPHLYDSKNKKNYWLGICMLLMQLDSQAMDSLLMGPEGQASIPQCIINTMNDCNKDDPGSDPFWPALHCFLVVLDRLGSKIWGQIEPLDAFQAITKADSYMAEIKNIRQKTAGTRVKEETENHDDLLSCSQIVYDCYATERTSRSSNYSSGNSDTSGNAVFEEISCLVNVLQSEMGQGMRVYGSTFLWFIPFVRSIMELNVLNSICIGEVIHYLDNNADKDVLSGRTHTCDKVTEFFIRILVDIIELHLSKGCMETLSYFTHIWVDLVMQCATLSGDIFHTRIHEGRGVFAASSHFSRGTRMPAVGVGVGAVSQACMKLIRSLLKEGGPTATETAPFLNLVNKQMRSVSARGWNLPKSEYENLKKCLIKLVKAISERPAVPNDVLPCAPPTPPSEPSENIISYPNPTLTPPLQQVQTRDVEVGPSRPIGTIDFIKNEPPWDHGECQSFYDGQEEMIKIKKEACKPIPCSEFGSPPEVNYIKKIDLGKGQEIESGKIRDVTKKKFETEDEQGKCSGLKEFGHASDVSLQPSTSQSNVSGSARFSKSCKRTLDDDDDDDDDEPFDVRLRRLKRPVESRNENSTESRQVSIPLPSSAEKVDEASVIATSEVSSNDQKLLENRVARDPSFDSSTTPGRCYDYLSESQLFECETEEYVASAWNEPDTDVPVVTKKQKLDSKACISPEAVEPMQSPEAVEPMQSPEAVEPMQTQPVPDEDVERACLQVEAQICKQQQPHEPTTSNIQVPSKPSSNEKYDFVQSKHFKSPPEKTGLTDKKGKQWLCRKPPVIEALSQKIKKHCRTHNISPNPVKPCSSTTLTVASPSMVVPSRGCPASSVARSPSTPAIVPPKKVRKRAEPESPAELLGLKKKERKAFDLSQRSLVSLGELRSHGQNVHVEPQQKSKRVRQKKVGAKKGKKMLASQDMQYFIQSRRMLQKPTAATGVVAKSNKFTVPETLSKSKPAIETVSESGDEEDDYDFLPCSQPDPDRRVDSKTGSCQVNTHLSDESKKAVNDWSENITSKEFSSHQNNKGACSSMPEGAESRDGNCGGDDDDDDDDEWTSLTQNEPTDMELCSQMEQMEVEYGESLYTVSDFGNQPNISKGETSVPLQPLSGNPPQKSLPDASTEMSSNEHLFLKPSMPPECQKKTKPSTTKIYSSNSRSATLVKEMGKVANPPSAANVAKAKVARPPPAMPPPPLPKPPPKSTPQPEFRQPLPPRPSLNPLKPDLKSSLSSVTSASHVPSYKTYPRPEAPVPIQTPTVAQNRRPDNTPMYEPSYLKRAILKWEYHMFDNYRMFGTPKDLCPFALKEVPTNFYSYQEYFNILYPLLLINTFEEMVREWLNGRKVRIELHVQAIEYHNCIASASFKVCLNAEQVKKQLYPREDDLVLLWLPENTGAYANDEPGFTENIHFGCVVKSMLSNGGPLYLTIQTRGNVSSVNTQPVRCEVIGSLISTLREFRALCLLQKSKLELPVLKPDMKYFAPCQDDLTNLDMPEYNRDQAKAISCGVAMVKRKQNTPKILLIHGPPGTGKSKIIVGMLHRFLSDGESPSLNRYAKSRRRRILLCTPSNAAIDNLMKKIIILFKDMCLDKDAPQGNCGDINLVRLGSERTISEYLTPFSLDSQVKKRLEKAQQICDSDIQRKKEELDKQIEKLSRQCAETGKKSATFEQLNARKLKCLQEREELSKQLKEFRSKRQSVQSRLLHDAHVICCTLSTSGSTLLEFAFRNLGHEPFNCVIVDEAGQAKETETLIPLLYRCPNLILVGDPMQLPPTVVSQTAKQLGYDQSLMARLCKTRLYPSIFLSFQYRMHPVICEFPSKYIYNNDLKSDRETARKLCSSSWPFEPYRVFDVIDGKERREGDSFSNLKEVNLVLLLLKLLGEKHAMRKEKQQIRAGIITPYNAQKQRLLQALQNDTDKEYKKCIQVEVDTVDGFQGREMDCIIVSCVRASNENGSIGFVANRQRMNVTITRAKFSLFILGHLCTLKQSEWGALIEDAKARGTVIEAHESSFHQVTKKVLKPIPFSHSHSYPPNIPASSEDHRMHTRPSDPRLAEAHRSSREQDGANQSFTHPRPPSRRPSDPRFQQSSARSFRAPPERRYDRHNASSGSCRAYRK